MWLDDLGTSAEQCYNKSFKTHLKGLHKADAFCIGRKQSFMQLFIPKTVCIMLAAQTLFTHGDVLLTNEHLYKCQLMGANDQVIELLPSTHTVEFG